MAAISLLVVLALVGLALDQAVVQASLSSFPTYTAHSKSHDTLPQQAKKIAIVSSNRSPLKGKGLGQFLRSNQQSYARAHGYAYIDARNNYGFTAPQPSTSAPRSTGTIGPTSESIYTILHYKNNTSGNNKKLSSLLHVMETYQSNFDWILWMDSGDANIFTQYNIRIEDRIQEFERLYKQADQDQKTGAHGKQKHSNNLCMVSVKKDNDYSSGFDTIDTGGVLLVRNSDTTRTLILSLLLTNPEVLSMLHEEPSTNCCLILEEQTAASPTLLQSQFRRGTTLEPGHWIVGFPDHYGGRWALFASLRTVGTQLQNNPPPLFSPVEFPSNDSLDALPVQRKERFEAVQAAIQHAWKGYANVCIGPTSLTTMRRNQPVVAHLNRLAPHMPADDLSPLTQNGNDWLYYAATLHDSLDTLYLAGLTEEYESAVEFILTQDIQATSLKPTKTFEYSLRVVGGLLGTFSLTGDPRLLSRAKDAADALLQSPFWSSPTVLPRMYDVLFPPRDGSILYKIYARLYQWGRDAFTHEHHTNSLAGVGTFTLEFYFLSQVLEIEQYKNTGYAIFDLVTNTQSDNGMVPGVWNVMTGLPMAIGGTLGSGSDSFYEYLLKVPLIGCGTDASGRLSCTNDETLEAMLVHYKKVTRGALRDNHLKRRNTVDGEKGGENGGAVVYPVERQNHFHHLLCFLPGILALGYSAIQAEMDEPGDDMSLAEEMIRGCEDMYEQTSTGLAPENAKIETKAQPRGDKSYLLRPEYIESVFVMYRLTGDKKYQEMGWRVFESLQRYCKTETGYTGLRDVYDQTGGQRLDDMPSYFIAETLKYLLLLFAPDDYVSLGDFVFTTEAHPMKRLHTSDPLILPDEWQHRVLAPFPWLLWLAVAVALAVLSGFVVAFTSLARRFFLRRTVVARKHL